MKRQFLSLTFILSLVLLFSFSSCKKDVHSGNEIPNSLGLNPMSSWELRQTANGSTITTYDPGNGNIFKTTQTYVSIYSTGLLKDSFPIHMVNIKDNQYQFVKDSNPMIFYNLLIISKDSMKLTNSINSGIVSTYKRL